MKILIVGLGGIGSHLVGEIVECVKQNQIPMEVEFDVADDDIVECKNVKFQNYLEEEIGENKAVSLITRYADYFNATAYPYRIEKEDDLGGYNLIICCADNFNVRKLIFEYCHQHGKEFIDLRAEGRFVMDFQKTKFDTGTDLDKEYALKTDLKTLNLNDNENGSCQKKADLEKGILQKGYKISAAIGIQMLLNYLRGEVNNKILMRI